MAAKLTAARHTVLKRCASEHGFHPYGTDWRAIYWLRAGERQYVERVRDTFGAAARYVATPAGRQALAEASGEEGERS
jgi:hypothetical protein